MATGERLYSSVQVFGSARGMNRNSWKGAISDDQVTYAKNISTTFGGEWRKRSGYSQMNSDAVTWSATTQTIRGISDHSRASELVVWGDKDVFRRSASSGTYVFLSMKSATGCTLLTSSKVATCAAGGNLYAVAGDNKLRYSGNNSGSWTHVKDATGDLRENSKYITYYHGHLWLAGLTGAEHKVRASKLDFDPTDAQATAWPTLNAVFSCKDDVMGIHPYSGYLIVGTKSTVEGISGYTSSDFEKIILSTTASCASHWSMQEVALADDGRTALLWAGYDGIYMLMGNSVRKISWEIQDIWDNVNVGYLETGCDSVDCKATGEYLLAVPYGSSQKANMIICFNYKRGDFTIWKLGESNGTYVNITSMGSFLESGRQRVLVGDDSGFVFQLFNGNDDVTSTETSVPVDGILATKWYDGGMPDIEKDFRKMYLWVEPSGNFDIDITWNKDYEEEDDLTDNFLLSLDGETINLGGEITYPSVVPPNDATLTYGSESNQWSDAVTDDSDDWVISPDVTDGLDLFFEIPATSANVGNKVFVKALYTTDGVTSDSVAIEIFNFDTNNYESAGTISSIDINKTNGINFITDYSTFRIPVTADHISGVDDIVKIRFVTSDTTISNVLYIGFIEMYEDSPLYDATTSKYSSSADTVIKEIDLKNTRSKAIRFIFRCSQTGSTFKIKAFKILFTPIQEFPG